MSEGPPKQPPQEAEDGAHPEISPKEEYILLAKELFESRERFPFPGIDPEAYSRIKADEAEFPGYTTPIDELIERFKNEGMKVVLGKYPDSGNVYILPAESDDIKQDSIFPRQLLVDELANEKIKTLILLNRG